MKPIIGENIWIKVSIGCSSFVIELPTLSLAEQPVDFNLFKFQISLARIFSGTSPELGKPAVSNGGSGVSERCPNRAEANYCETGAPMKDHR